VVSSFLLINVALGLFGILNVSIAKRRSEIGLRRALGATGRGISRQFVGEMWVLTTVRAGARAAVCAAISRS
jgi:putative ABC transport system permease protein